jgi:hypothetical protein
MKALTSSCFVDINEDSSCLQHGCEILKSLLLLLEGGGGYEDAHLGNQSLMKKNLGRAFFWGPKPERYLAYWLQALGIEIRSR